MQEPRRRLLDMNRFLTVVLFAFACASPYGETHDEDGGVDGSVIPGDASVPHDDDAGGVSDAGPSVPPLPGVTPTLILPDPKMKLIFRVAPDEGHVVVSHQVPHVADNCECGCYGAVDLSVVDVATPGTSRPLSESASWATFSSDAL